MADIKVYGNLVNWTADYPSYVVSTDQVYDTKKRKTQEEINEAIGFTGGLFNVNVNCGPRKEGGNYDLESAIVAVYNDSEIIKPEDRNGIAITFWNGLVWENWRYKNYYDVDDPRADLRFVNPRNWEVFDTTLHESPIVVLSEEEYAELLDIKPNILYCLYETEPPTSDETIDVNTHTFFVTGIEDNTAISLGTIEGNTLFLYEGSGEEATIDVANHILSGVTSIQDNKAMVQGTIEDNTLNV